MLFHQFLLCLVGLQGSGKTTTAAKLAQYLEKNYKKKVLLVSLDVYRPAAQEQLKILGEQNSLQTLPVMEGSDYQMILLRRSLSTASLSGSDIIIFDTAGRTQIDLSMMGEIKELKSTLNTYRSNIGSRFFNRTSSRECSYRV